MFDQKKERTVQKVWGEGVSDHLFFWPLWILQSGGGLWKKKKTLSPRYFLNFFCISKPQLRSLSFVLASWSLLGAFLSSVEHVKQKLTARMKQEGLISQTLTFRNIYIYIWGHLNS